MKKIISLLLILLSINAQSQNCSVNAGNDISICTGETAVLSGSNTGLFFHWQADSTLSDTSILFPIVTPNQTTTYVLESEYLTTTNLISNSDFSSGNLNFTSGYIYRPPPNYGEGEYWVAPGPLIPSWNGGMASCNDHTSGNGMMMVVNGATTTNVPVWCQSVSIKPYTKYAFTCWLQSLTSPNPAQLQFSINNTPIGNIFTASLFICEWQQFYFIWNSGNNSTADICIVNQNSVAQANDFALDDIGFSPLCTAYDSVTVTVNPITISDNPHSICEGETYAFNNHIYSNPGNYNDTLISMMTGCDSVVITQLTVNPVYVISNNQEICTGQTYTINSHTYTETGLYYDTLTSQFGCDSIVITSLKFKSLPVINFSHPEDVCVNSPVLILDFATPTGGVYAGPGVTGNVFNPEKSSAGVHKISYTYTDPFTMCSNSAYEYITVHALPEIKFSVTPTTTIIEYPNIFFSDSTDNAVNWSWDFGDGTESNESHTKHTYEETGVYSITLLVTDSFGCQSSTESTVRIEREFKFYVPNSFTPNNDGVNDIFSGQGVGVNNYHLYIFNKWGVIIFESDNMNIPWKGIDAPNDSYVYKIIIHDFQGIEHEYTGWVYLTR